MYMIEKDKRYTMKLLERKKKENKEQNEKKSGTVKAIWTEMADDMDKDDASEKNENVIEVKRTMGKKGKAIVACAVLLMVVGMATAMYKYNTIKTYKGYDVVSSVETSGDNIADYVVFAGNMLKVTKDGASYIDEKGTTKWDVSYAMKMPRAEVCGSYAVVADMNGKDVYVFNTDGEVSRQTMNYDISNVDIAEQGVYSLVLTGEDGNRICCYDKDSSTIYELKTSIEQNGYPMDIDISNDGQKLVASYMRVKGTKIETVLAMYNFGSVGQNENADRLMGSYEVGDSVYPTVKFIDNDTIACFGDNDIRTYSMSEKPSEKAVIDLQNREMQGIFYNSSYVGYIALAESGSGSKYKVYIYGSNGNLKASADYSGGYDKIYATENEVIVVGDMDCGMLRFNGSTKFNYSFKKNLVNIVPDSNKEEYIVIFENETQTIILKNN